mgnify:CR=1 FL=1
MVASDINSMNLHPSSPKVSFIVAKKAYFIAKKIQESLQVQPKGK